MLAVFRDTAWKVRLQTKFSAINHTPKTIQDMFTHKVIYTITKNKLWAAFERMLIWAVKWKNTDGFIIDKYENERMFMRRQPHDNEKNDSHSTTSFRLHKTGVCELSKNQLDDYDRN